MNRMNEEQISKMARVLGEVYAERNDQHVKWGEQNHDPAYWVSILGEEFGEVCRAVQSGDMENYREELIQLAAVAAQMVECIDRTAEVIG